jgi:hypothetical protein
MRDPLDDAIEEFRSLVERARGYRVLPCVCDHSNVEAEEESLATCKPCHLDSLFDETLEHARSVVEFVERTADSPRQRSARPKHEKVRSNVVRFHPMARQPQPEALWKD